MEVSRQGSWEATSKRADNLLGLNIIWHCCQLMNNRTTEYCSNVRKIPLKKSNMLFKKKDLLTWEQGLNKSNQKMPIKSWIIFQKSRKTFLEEPLINISISLMSPLKNIFRVVGFRKIMWYEQEIKIVPIQNFKACDKLV